MRVLFTGGGTGGHFYPIVAVIKELKRIAEDERILNLRLFYMGPALAVREKTILEKEGVILYKVPSGKFRRYASFKNFTDIFKVARGIIHALWRLFFLMPDVIFSKGGYGSFPAVLVARIYRIPVIIHESDAVPGAVNKWTGKFARRIAVSFESAAEYFPKKQTALIGSPIRKSLIAASRDEAKKFFGIKGGDPVIFAVGGSQGAEVINNAVEDALSELIKRYYVIHQAGDSNYESSKLDTTQILEKGGGDKYFLFGFLGEDELRNAYAASDLIISRAGGSAIFEIAATSKPSILIPLKSAAQNHQHKNAAEYSKAGACLIIDEENLAPHILIAEIDKLVNDKKQMMKMSVSAQKFARIDAADAIAKEILVLGLH